MASAEPPPVADAAQETARQALVAATDAAAKAVATAQDRVGAAQDTLARESQAASNLERAAVVTHNAALPPPQGGVPNNDADAIEDPDYEAALIANLQVQATSI
jgi:hypothetical protein